VADALRNEPDVQVSVINGSKGEFTVTVDGQEVARMSGESMPEINDVVRAVRRSEAAAGARS
jgi:hypothetical protein